MPNFLKSLIPRRSDIRIQRAFNESRESEILPAELFLKMLCLERKRTERAGRRFVLMLLDPGNLLDSEDQIETLESILAALCRATRDTDIVGWAGRGSSIGVIFTEIGTGDASMVGLLSNRVSSALAVMLSQEQLNRISLSFQVFPDDCAQDDDRGNDAFSSLYPDLRREIQNRRMSLVAKRCMDVTGSLLALILISPLLLAIAVAIKTTSRGPVFYRQKRLGQFGKSFTFLKFRSMYVGSDHAVHEAFVRRFIAARDAANCDGVYKLKGDSRVTPVGKFLRRTSLDELPQFFNSLMGQMALVGPRPPVSYEFNAYELWHRRRLLAVKPGITGPWQVKGRSRVQFNEMVRMDLEYARHWSIWLDLKILWQTPRAVLIGEGAQ